MDEERGMTNHRDNPSPLPFLQPAAETATEPASTPSGESPASGEPTAAPITEPGELGAAAAPEAAAPAVDPTGLWPYLRALDPPVQALFVERLVVVLLRQRDGLAVAGQLMRWWTSLIHGGLPIPPEAACEAWLRQLANCDEDACRRFVYGELAAICPVALTRAAAAFPEDYTAAMAELASE